MVTVLICVILVLIVVFALRGSRKHFKGESGCCGGGDEISAEVKQLDGEKLGEKIVHIEGMHCDNCKNRVQNAINRIDDAAAKVSLRKKEAVVSYDRAISDEDIRRAVEKEDYRVTSIDDHPIEPLI